MRIAVFKETAPGEKRVALVPSEIPRLTQRKLQISLETGAGVASGYPDSAYAAKGAHPGKSRADLLAESDVLLWVRKPEAALWQGLRAGQTVIGMLDPLAQASSMVDLARFGITAFAMELMPRITRAQNMDVLSSMANLAGYKAVILAAYMLPRILPMMMTAAGTISPAKILVLGAGVAGLQAIATARRLGAVVDAYDVRPEVGEQIQSVGGKPIDLGLDNATASDKSGYARSQSDAFYAQQRQKLATYVRAADAIITTAAIPGKRAPTLVTEEMLRGTKPGSVLIDLAAETGGNCALTRAGEQVEWEGIRIVGPLNLPSSMAFHASQLYARNIVSFLDLLCTPEGLLQLNREDEIVRSTLVLDQGKLVHPQVQAQLAEPK